MYPSYDQRRPHSQIMRLCVWDRFITDKVLLLNADNLLYSGPYSSKESEINGGLGGLSLQQKLQRACIENFKHHFTVVSSVNWVLNSNEAEGDLALI